MNLEFVLLLGLWLVVVGGMIFMGQRHHQEQKNLKQTNALLIQELQQMKQSLTLDMEQRMSQGFYQNQNTIHQAMQQVSTSMGEMQRVVASVERLEDVLANVKTRGIFGEVQLFQCIEDVLPPQRIKKNIATLPHSKEVVECAIELEDGLLLPIDAKFPLQHLYAIIDATDQSQLQSAQKNLVSVMKSNAKDIRSKYVARPYTTDFAILFIPIETLYFECLKLELVELLRQEYNIVLAGPSTLNAILNALYFGFQTLAVEHKSKEVLNVLAEVQKEYENFTGVVEQIQVRVHQLQKEVDTLKGVRSRKLEKALQRIELLNEEK